MPQALTIFDSGALPAHIASANDELANVVARQSVNALTFEGKVWTVNLDGKKTKLMKTNSDGEEEPVSIFTGVVVGYNDRGREFYAKAYDPKNPTVPDCWSEDGKAPHANVPTPCAKTCAACPNSKKGSSTNQAGGASTACGQFQKLAVIPAAKIGQFPPLRLRLKITSIYDKDGADKHPGWYAWSQYLDLLTSKGVRSTGLLPTKIKFDKDVAYPKLLFAPGKEWLDADSLEVVKEMMLSDQVKDLLAQTYDPTTSKTGNKALPEDDGDETEVAAAAVPAAAKPKAAKAAPASVADDDEDEVPVAPVKPAKAAKAAPAQVADDDEDEEAVQTAEQQAAAKRAARATEQEAIAAKAVAKANKAAKAPPVATDDDDDETVVVAPAKPAKANGAAAPAKGGAKPTAAKGAPLDAPAEVADMLGDWDD